MAVLKRKIPKHSYSGDKWKTNPTNKKYLAIDFDHHCAYCDDKDVYSGGERAYEVEHFAPKSKFPALKNTYENLLYACPYCNGAKSNTWVSNDAAISVVGNKGFVSPCNVDYYTHLTRNADGTISATTELGKYMRKHLKLFLRRHSIIFLLEEVDKRCDQLETLIDAEEAKGNDTTKLKIAHSELTRQLRQYYKIIYNNPVQ